VSDAVEPRERAQAVGVYRFWRDIGIFAGALLAGLTADAFGFGAAISIVAGLTAASGLWVAATRWRKVVAVHSGADAGHTELARGSSR